jgi:hypothetical protein
VAGGCPEGYLLPDQLEWIKSEISRADEDPSVKYTVLFAQEPVFPCGGHIKDATWHNGDNNARAYRMHPDPDGGESLQRERKGLLEVRNELVRAVSASPKVAAFLAGDEHSYHRILIGPEVPIGDPDQDDLDGDGKIESPAEPVSPLGDLAHQTWFVTSGGAGATYYSEEDVPWVDYWRARQAEDDSEARRFYYSSQENVLIFKADDVRIGMCVYNKYGEEIDEIEDLMKAKPIRR